MNWNKLGIRLEIASPGELGVLDYIPVFHKWIQGQVFEDHLLVDVHNYSHVKDGPGILLVAHEGQFSLSFDESQPALSYVRRRPFDGGTTPQECLRRVFRTTLFAASMLESEGIAFIDGRLDVLVNDRLNTSSVDDATQLEAVLSDFLRQHLKEVDFSVEHFQESSGILTLALDSADDSMNVNLLLEKLT
jgi:hypothetical protein